MASHTMSIDASAIPCCRRKSRAALALSTSKRSVDAAVFLGQTHVVEHGANIEKLGVELQSLANAREGAEEVDAGRVMEQERGLGLPH